MTTEEINSNLANASQKYDLLKTYFKKSKPVIIPTEEGE
jgi:hypothetical protein